MTFSSKGTEGFGENVQTERLGKIFDIRSAEFPFFFSCTHVAYPVEVAREIDCKLNG